MVASVDVQLARDVAASLTWRRDEATLDYLSSGPIRIVLVRGPDALERTYRLKHKARAEMGTTNLIRNLIHACDAGRELALYLRHFFPAYDQPRYRGFADQFWVVSDIPALERTVQALPAVHPGAALVPVVRAAACDPAAASRLLARFGHRYLGVLEPDGGSRWPGVAVVAYHSTTGHGIGPVGLALTGAPDAVQRLVCTGGAVLRRQYPFLVCQRPEWSLATVEEMDGAARHHGFVPLFGSGESREPFVSRSKASRSTS
jgi:hypothetical protein